MNTNQYIIVLLCLVSGLSRAQSLSLGNGGSGPANISGISELHLGQRESREFQISGLHTQGVFIAQMGDENTLNVHSSTTTERSIYYQQGHFNSINSSLYGLDIQQDIRQLGDKNAYDRSAISPFSQDKIQVLQQGNNQYISIYGSNSMSNDMKIHVQGSDTALIIRNYN